MRKGAICRSLRSYFPLVAATVRVVAHSAPVLVAPVRAPLLSVDGPDLRCIPSSSCGGARCYMCVVPQCVFFFWAGVFLGAKIDETFTRSASTGRDARCCRAGWFQRWPLESSTCRGTESCSIGYGNPALDKWKLPLSPVGRLCLSPFTQLCHLVGGVPWVGLYLWPW